MKQGHRTLFLTMSFHLFKRMSMVCWALCCKPVSTSPWRKRQNNQNFKIILGYIVNLTPTCTTGDPVIFLKKVKMTTVTKTNEWELLIHLLINLMSNTVVFKIKMIHFIHDNSNKTKLCTIYRDKVWATKTVTFLFYWKEKQKNSLGNFKVPFK